MALNKLPYHHRNDYSFLVVALMVYDQHGIMFLYPGQFSFLCELQNKTSLSSLTLLLELKFWHLRLIFHSGIHSFTPIVFKIENEWQWSGTQVKRRASIVPHQHMNKELPYNFLLFFFIYWLLVVFELYRHSWEVTALQVRVMEFCLILFTVVNVTLTCFFLSDKLVRLSNGTLLSLLQTCVNLNIGYKKKDEREKKFEYCFLSIQKFE